VIRLDGTGNYDFSTANISGIDTVNIASHVAGITVKLSDAMVSTADYNMNGSGGNIRVAATVNMTNDVTIDARALTSGNHLFINAANLGGNDTIYGGADSDQLNSGAGNDTITGGAGNDDLTGGAGADTFVFLAATDSSPGNGNFDTIKDFVSGTDHIDFSAIAGLQTAVFTTGIAVPVTLAAHSIDIVTTGGNTVVYANSTDATAAADMEIRLTGITNLSQSDFILHV